MNYTIILTPKFEKDISFYKKKKKFLSIDRDIGSIIGDLQNGNLVGDPIPGLTLDNSITIKVCIANSDTKSGKSNGYRVIYYAVKNDCEIYLLTVYSKKDDNRIPSNEDIKNLVNEYCCND